MTMMFWKKSLHMTLNGKPASVGDDTLVYAVGDIHGRLDLLTQLMDKITTHAKNRGATRTYLVFLGDYIDRGPDTKGVIDFLSSGLPAGFETIFLKGNHEQLMSGFLDQPEHGLSWAMNGGIQTILSYGVPLATETPDVTRLRSIREQLVDGLPDAHTNFLENLNLSVEIGDYFFTHAGIRPGVACDEQVENDLLWIRDDFLLSKSEHEKIIVHGHTPTKDVQLRKNRIGIDTGAFATNILTALALHETEVEFLHAKN